MKKLILPCLVLAAMLGLVAVAAHAHKCTTCPSFRHTTSLAAQNLATLQGCWRGASGDGVRSEVSYEMGSDGTALLETQWVDSYPAVYTVYYLDGENLAAHHFCSMGNQVRMRAVQSPDPNRVTFRYQDSTNMPRANQPHMTGTTVQFLDKDRIAVEWASFCDDGGGEIVTSFSYERVVDGCTVSTAKAWSER